MNKQRRYYKQYLQRILDRNRRIKRFVLWSMLRATATQGASQVAILRSTPADKFKDGKLGKVAAIADAVINTQVALVRLAERNF